MSEEWNVVDTMPKHDFVWPLGVMFVRMKLNLETHPMWKKTSHKKLSRSLWIHLTTSKYMVLVAPGALFAATEAIRVESSISYFRICFTANDKLDVAPMSHRFVEGLKTFWTRKKIDIDEDMAEDGKQRLSGLQLC